MNDLDPVAFGQVNCGPIRAADNFAVAFDRGAFIWQSQLFHQRRDRKVFGNLARFPVHFYPHAGRSLSLPNDLPHLRFVAFGDRAHQDRRASRIEVR